MSRALRFTYTLNAPTPTGWALSVDSRCLSVRLSVCPFVCLSVCPVPDHISQERKGVVIN